MNIQNSVFFKKLFVGYGVPMNRSMGIRLKSIDDFETVLTLKGKRKNTNYGGTIHGAAIMALGETVHGVSVLNKFGAFDHLMVSKDTNLKFMKKAMGDLEVRFSLSVQNEKHIESQLKKNGKCEVEFESAVTDHAGDIVAKLTATYHIRNRK